VKGNLIMALSSFDLRYNQCIQQMQQYFGDKDQVDRRDIMEYEKTTGNEVPTKFWNLGRIARGMFSINNAMILDTVPVQTTPSIEQTNHQVIDFPKKETIVHATHTENQFNISDLIPKQNPNFIKWGHYDTVLKLLSTNKFFTLYITGESGTGKNEMISHACAKLNRPLVRVSMTRDTKEEHLVGSKTLIDGNVVYEEGPAIWAAKNGAVLLLDEISMLDSSDAFSLQAILEGGSFFVKSANMTVTPKEGFCVIATDNTKGRGSDSGRYIGTNILNDAFLERFEMMLVQTYPPEKVERRIIDKTMSNLGIQDENFAKNLVTWISTIRKTYVADGLDDQISTRRACHIIKSYDKLGDANLAIELCVNRFDDTTRQAMMSLWEKICQQPTTTPTSI
jgi:hypothetical protein